MTDYTSIANALKTTLTADSWLGNTVNVKTVEIHQRGENISRSGDSLYFASNETPALAIVPNVAKSTSALISAEEVLISTRCQILGFTFDVNAQTGMANHIQLLTNLERVLEKQKSEQDDLGIGARVWDVSSQTDRKKKGSLFYFVSKTEFNVEQIATV